VIQRHAAIGRKGPENDAYVAAYKAKKAAGEDFDPSALADEVMQQMQQPPALALNQAAQQPMLDVYRPLAAPSTASATTPPVAGKPAPLSTEANAFADSAPAAAPITPTTARSGVDPYAETKTTKFVDSFDKSGKPIKVPIKKDPFGLESGAVGGLLRKLMPVPTNDEERRLAAQQRK
jgi:hypothetical protein